MHFPEKYLNHPYGPVDAPVNPLYNMPPSPGGYQRTREMTIDDLLLENRVVFLVGEINYASATRLIMQLLYLSNINKKQDIHLYINSPGGVVDDTMAIYDTMKFIPCDVATYCIGRAMSGGSVVLAAGTKGKRYSLPHAKVMIHQPHGAVGGQTTDVQIQAEDIIKTKNMLNNLLAELTGQTPEKLKADAERDKFFSAEEAKEYGLVDEVLKSSNEAASNPTSSGTKNPGGQSS